MLTAVASNETLQNTCEQVQPEFRNELVKKLLKIDEEVLRDLDINPSVRTSDYLRSNSWRDSHRR
jgi:hypothetical protein